MMFNLFFFKDIEASRLVNLTFYQTMSSIKDVDEAFTDLLRNKVIALKHGKVVVKNIPEEIRHKLVMYEGINFNTCPEHKERKDFKDIIGALKPYIEEKSIKSILEKMIMVYEEDFELIKGPESEKYGISLDGKKYFRFFKKKKAPKEA